MEKDRDLKTLKWTETKREFAYNENGNLSPKSATLEPNVKQRQVRDLVFQSIPILGLIISILIFYSGQRADREKEYENRNAELNRERGKLQIEYYSQLSFQLHTLFQKELSTKAFDSLKFELQYHTYRKVTFLNDKKVMSFFNGFMPKVERYIVLTNICKSLNKSRNTSTAVLGSFYLAAFMNSNFRNKEISNTRLKTLGKLIKKTVDSLQNQQSYLSDIIYSNFPDFRGDDNYREVTDTMINFRNDIENKPIERKIGYYLIIYWNNINSLDAAVHRSVRHLMTLPVDSPAYSYSYEIVRVRDSLFALKDSDAKRLDSLTNILDEITRKNSWLYNEKH